MKKKNFKNPVSVSVAIPAHNEEKNIRQLIGQIQAQKCGSFRLEKIIVMLDGCTDKTEKIVEQCASDDNRIKLVCDGKRLGKAERLNQIYQLNKSSLLITLDADLFLNDEEVFENLVSPLIADLEVAVVGGNVRPFPGRNFVEKIIVIKDQWWYEARRNFNGGNNIYNSGGPCYALRNDFIKSLKFPRGTINDFRVIFLHAALAEKKFFFAEKAIVFLREATNLSELVIRARRYEYIDDLLSGGYDSKFASLGNLPRMWILKSIFLVFIRNPFCTAASILLYFYLKIATHKKNKSEGLSSGIWETSKSTKESY